jgi:hypothetical protein
MTRTGLDPWDAHVAAIADAAVCPVLTLRAVKWRQPSAALDEQLHIIEISDPDDSMQTAAVTAGWTPCRQQLTGAARH